MNVKKSTLRVIIAGLSLLATSCQTSQQLLEPKLSLQHIEKIQMQTIGDVALPDQPIALKYHAMANELKEPVKSKYATILGVLPQAIKNLSLYSFVEDWYGVRYRLGGDSKNGIDCSAFVRRLYENVFCVNLLRTAYQQFGMCHFVSKRDSVKEGDLVFFKTHGRRISHVGIYLMNDYFVHASSSQGVMISNLNDEYWDKRYAGAGAINKERM